MEDYQSLIHCFVDIFKIPWISDIENDPSDNSNSSFNFGADILNLLFLHHYMCSTCVIDLTKQHIYHSLLSLFCLKAWVIVCEVRCFTIFITNKYSIHFVSCFCWIQYIVTYCFSNFFCSIQIINYLKDFV